MLDIIFMHQKSSTEYMECACRYFVKAALDFALSVLRTVTLGGTLLKIFMSEQCIHANLKATKQKLHQTCKILIMLIDNSTKRQYRQISPSRGSADYSTSRQYRQVRPR